jgi:hypothetical protein
MLSPTHKPLEKSKQFFLFSSKLFTFKLISGILRGEVERGTLDEYRR